MPKKENKYNNWLSEELIVTPSGNYIVPSLHTFMQHKADSAAQAAAQHIQQQMEPNVPKVPNRGPISWIAAKIFGMSDEERIRRWGTEDAATCIYTATNQYNDKGSLVSGNKTFRDTPQKYGFIEIPMDSAKTGDMIQFSDIRGIPHHSVMMTGKNTNGKPLLSYSNGSNKPFETWFNEETQKEDTTWTMKRNMPIDTFKVDTPAAFRYIGSPQKRRKWREEYSEKYGVPIEMPTPQIKQSSEQPDATKVSRPDLKYQIKQKAEGGFLKPKDAWDALSMKDKADMIGIAVKHGITTLSDIRDKYNEFAEGGNLYDVGGYAPSESIKKRISRWEGDAMVKDTIDPLSGKMAKKNRPFEEVTRGFVRALPSSIAERVLSNPELADNLYSYVYNVGPGNFKKRVVPVLEKFYNGDATVDDVTSSMWASGDKKLRGLRSRRAEEKAGVRNALLGHAATSTVLEPTTPALVATNNYVSSPYPLLTEEVQPTPLFYHIEDRSTDISPSPEELERQERREALDRFNTIMSLIGIKNPLASYTSDAGNSFLDTLGLFTNENADGGKIHIKPSHRGRLTELKKRTGKTEAELYRTGSPATRKMITFARNARKWKHSLGGDLLQDAMAHVYGPGGDITYGHPFYSYDNNGQLILDENGKPIINYNATIPEVTIIPNSKKSPAQRNSDERFRQRNLRDYDENKSREYTTRQVIQAQRDWENSAEKKALDYAQSVAMGVGIGADIVSGLPIYSSLKGVSTLNRAETPLEYIEGGLWLTPMLGGTYKGIKPIFKTASKPINSTNLFEATQFSTKTPEVTGRLLETQQAAEKGRNKLLGWIQSPFYRQRLEEEPFYRFSNDIANEASTIVKDAPLDFSKTVREIDPSGNIAGTTKTRPALKVRDDGYRVFDLNTGLDVNIGSDLGSEAEDTTLHELLHYLTVNSKGIPESTSTMQIVDKGWMQPLEALYNPVGKNILRGKKWQNYILDQNDALLPKYDSVVDMVMNRPDEAKAALLKAGRTEAQADVAIKSLQDRYAYWADIQEQRAHLQELFISKIKPHLKNPNDAAEIESFLSQHPEILENSAPYNYIQEVRPGSLKQYAGYFASALSTLPFINKLTTNEQ